ncbi:MAG: sigma-54 dependent transcriptional regulator [Desulfatiglandaceae bacterium]
MSVNISEVSRLDKKNNVSILVVDDERGIRQSLKMFLQDFYNVYVAGTGSEAVEIISKKSIDVILLDIRLPDVDGVELIKVLKDIDPDPEIIMVTAIKEVESAVQAMKSGAFDYLVKPFVVEDIKISVSRAIENRGMKRQVSYVNSEFQRIQPFEKIVGSDQKMLQVYELVSKVAASAGAVLIQGESGTGKELVARAIHNLSPRKDRPFVVINCAAIPSTLMESEVFGHTRGAFTGATSNTIGKIELGHKGTVFLDDVDTLDLAMQAKMLRVLQEKELERLGSTKLIPVDVRFVAASNKPLKQLIDENKFREDFFYRLNVFPVQLPPLRERKGDIPILLDYFSKIQARNTREPPKSFSSEAIATLTRYDWPGNVRELQNLVERLSVIVKEPVIENLHLAGFQSLEKDKGTIGKTGLKEAVKSFERSYIREILDQTGGNRKKASKILGVHRNTLLAKIQQLEP